MFTFRYLKWVPRRLSDQNNSNIFAMQKMRYNADFSATMVIPYIAGTTHSTLSQQMLAVLSQANKSSSMFAQTFKKTRKLYGQKFDISDFRNTSNMMFLENVPNEFFGDSTLARSIASTKNPNYNGFMATATFFLLLVFFVFYNTKGVLRIASMMRASNQK